MVGAGMTPVQAIRTATAGNADLLGLAHEIGTIEEGKQADLLVVRGGLTGSIEPLTRRANLALILQGGLADAESRQP